MFEEEEIGGVYWKSGKDENNETYYKKEDPTRFLSRKVVGRWTISKYLNNHTYVMFQTLYDETSDWIVDLAYMDSFEEISGNDSDTIAPKPVPATGECCVLADNCVGKLLNIKTRT